MAQTYSGWQAGQRYYYSEQLSTPLTVLLNFDDGSSLSKTASAANLFWQFQYNSNAVFSSLSVSWGITPTLS